MNVEFITKDDLERFKNEIIKEINSGNQNQIQKKWLRSAEVREMLGISPGTLQNMRINGTIPFTKIGATLFYSMEDIQFILVGNMSFSKS